MRYSPARIRLTTRELAGLGFFPMIWKSTGRHQIMAVVLAITVALLHIAPIEVQRRAVDDAIPGPDLQLLMLLSLAYVVLVLLYQFAKFLLNSYQSWIGESTNQFLRDRLIELERDCSVHRDGEFASVMVGETAKFGEFAGEGISQVFIDIGMLVGVLAYMIYMEPQIALAAFLLLMPQAVLTPFMQRKLNELVSRKIRLNRDLGKEVVGKDANLEDASITTGFLFHNSMRFAVMKFLLKASLGFLSALGPILIIAIGGYLVIRGQTSLGVMVAFLTGFNKLQEPIHGLVLFYRNAAQASVQYEMIHGWISEHAALMEKK